MYPAAEFVLREITLANTAADVDVLTHATRYEHFSATELVAINKAASERKHELGVRLDYELEPTFRGFRLHEESGLRVLSASCACNECRDGQRGLLGRRVYGQGHFACSPCSPELLAAEDRGEVSAMYLDGCWAWVVK